MEMLQQSCSIWHETKKKIGRWVPLTNKQEEDTKDMVCNYKELQ